MSNKLWEIYDGEAFVSCVECAYKHLVELYKNNKITVEPIYDKNYVDDISGVTASEDFFNEHTLDNCEVEHFCLSCNRSLDN